MIEQIMYFLLGVLMATLVALLVLPAVWHRAVRLTTKRVEAAVPVSIFEVQADKDQQRAFFALNQRRLELQLDSLRESLVGHAATIEAQRRKIHDLQRAFTDLDTRHAVLTATGAERDVLLGEVQDQAADRAGRITVLEAEGAARDSSLATLEAELDQVRQQGEAARQAHAAALAEIAALESALSSRSGELAAQTAALAAVTSQRDTLDRSLASTQIDLDASRSVIHAFEQRRASEFAAAESNARQITDDLERLKADHAMMAAALDAARAATQPAAASGASAAAGPADAQVLKAALADMAAHIVAQTARQEGAASPIPGLVAGTQHGSADTPDLATRIRSLLDAEAAGPQPAATAPAMPEMAPPALFVDDSDAPEAEDGALPRQAQVAAQ